MNKFMELTKPTPEDEARRFCLYAGWHHNGDTSAMLGNGGIVQLPEVMVAFYRHLIAENTHLRELLEESLKYQIKTLLPAALGSVPQAPDSPNKPPCPNCGCNHFRGENTLCNDGVPQAEPPKEEKPWITGKL